MPSTTYKIHIMHDRRSCVVDGERVSLGHVGEPIVHHGLGWAPCVALPDDLADLRVFRVEVDKPRDVNGLHPTREVTVDDLEAPDLPRGIEAARYAERVAPDGKGVDLDPFMSWLKLQRHRISPIGDVARDLAGADLIRGQSIGHPAAWAVDVDRILEEAAAEWAATMPECDGRRDPVSVTYEVQKARRAMIAAAFTGDREGTTIEGSTIDDIYHGALGRLGDRDENYDGPPLSETYYEGANARTFAERIAALTTYVLDLEHPEGLDDLDSEASMRDVLTALEALARFQAQAEAGHTSTGQETGK